MSLLPAAVSKLLLHPSPWQKQVWITFDEWIKIDHKSLKFNIKTYKIFLFRIAYISIEVFRGAVEQTLVRHLCAVPRISRLLPTCWIDYNHPFWPQFKYFWIYSLSISLFVLVSFYFASFTHHYTPSLSCTRWTPSCTRSKLPCASRRSFSPLASQSWCCTGNTERDARVIEQITYSADKYSQKLILKQEDASDIWYLFSTKYLIACNWQC